MASYLNVSIRLFVFFAYSKMLSNFSLAGNHLILGGGSGKCLKIGTAARKFVPPPPWVLEIFIKS